MDKLIQTGVDCYDKIQGRNTGEQIFECKFGGKIGGTFIKGGQLLSGKFLGACGMRKDNERIYCCPACYPSKTYNLYKFSNSSRLKSNERRNS